MRYGLHIIGFIFMLLAFASCKSAYNPAPVAAITNYLVVEGVINTGADSTFIKLSRTLNTASSANQKPELRATVTVESNQGGATYPLKELGNGTYVAAPLNLNSANQYRIRIKTSDGKTYVSDFSETKVSPQIDSVSWKATNNGVEIYASTHNGNNTSRYYRWDYTETWEFRSNYQSFYISDGLKITIRRQDQMIWDCFTSDESANIILGSTAKLSQDVIVNQNIAIIPQSAEKIGYKYSILVRQYALTLDAYNYWTQLKQNTEQLGSIFDPQPSASVGNLHCLTNTSEPVIGFVSAGTVTSQRIFIAKTQLPNWTTTPFYPKCELDTTWLIENTMIGHLATQDKYVNYKSSQYQFKSGSQALIPVTQLGNSSAPDYTAAAPTCVDCTLRGNKTPPSFWK